MFQSALFAGVSFHFQPGLLVPYAAILWTRSSPVLML
jgi:hypothetical protein